MTTIAISALPAAIAAAATDVLPIVQGGITKKLTNTLLFTNPIIAGMTNSGLSAMTAAAPTLTSGTTIAPTKQISFVSGTSAIVNITAPSPISSGGGQITLIPTGVFTWTAAGNIALLGTAVVGKALIMTYDVTTNKWYPSYVA